MGSFTCFSCHPICQCLEATERPRFHGFSGDKGPLCEFCCWAAETRVTWHSVLVHGSGMVRDKNGACERRLPQ